jgi:hypothetical protein
MNKIYHINRREEIQKLNDELQDVRNNWLPFCFHGDSDHWSARDEERAIEREIKALKAKRGGRATRAILEAYNTTQIGPTNRLIIANKKRVVAILKTPLNLFQKQVVSVVIRLGHRPTKIAEITIKTEIKGELC